MRRRKPEPVFRRAAPPRLGRDIDYFTAVTLLDHLIRRGLQHEKQAFDIGAENEVPVIRGYVFQRTQIHDTRIIHKDIHRSRQLYGFFHDTGQ